MISVKSLYKSFGTLPVLTNLTFSVAKGEFVSILGPSGCGKSTLLRILAGLIPVTAGEVLIDSESPDEARRRGKFGVVFQKPVLLPWRTVRENVRLPLELLGSRFSAVYRQPDELLQELGLHGFENAMPRELSGGMQHRVALARALVFQPAILIMDEPFAALDELLREKLDHELQELTRRLGQTVVLATHSIAEAVKLSDRLIILGERPTGIKAVLPVDLKWPREENGRSTRHQELVTETRHLLGVS